jgi:predicted lipoprotein with Yx(FWY)xxD motif
MWGNMTWITIDVYVVNRFAAAHVWVTSPSWRGNVMRRTVGTNVSLVLCGVVLAAGTAACSGTPAKTAENSPRAVTGEKTAVPPTGIQIEDSAVGPILADQNGRTLYAFTNDKNGTSSCTGTCIATWPALTGEKVVTGGTGVDASLLTTVSRSEGAAQAVYGDWPLYYYAGDVGAGDIDGQGVDGAWFVVGTDGKLIKADPAS